MDDMEKLPIAEDPVDAYDSKYGKPGADHPKLSDDQLWGERQNPVEGDTLPATNLRTAG